MRKPISLLLLALFCVLIVAGCKLPLEPRLQGVSEFRPHGRAGGRDPGITLGLDIHNPNPYKIKVLAYHLEIFLNGKKVGDAQHKGKQVMAGNETSKIDVEVATDMSQVLGGLLGVLGGLMGQEPAIDLKVTGTVLARAKGIQKQVPVALAKQFALGK